MLLLCVRIYDGYIGLSKDMVWHKLALLVLLTTTTRGQRWDSSSDERRRAVTNDRDSAWKTTLLCDAKSYLDRALHIRARLAYPPADPGKMSQMFVTFSGADDKRQNCNCDSHCISNAYIADGIQKSNFRTWFEACSLWYLLASTGPVKTLEGATQYLTMVPLRFAEHGLVRVFCVCLCLSVYNRTD